MAHGPCGAAVGARVDVARSPINSRQLGAIRRGRDCIPLAGAGGGRLGPRGATVAARVDVAIKHTSRQLGAVG